jgi:hypothetical protein
MKLMKSYSECGREWLVAIGLGFFSWSGIADTPVRTELPFPDIPGYVTLRCDLHAHTVFSDGQVWPTLRVDEAWQEGLDVLALTDHIEYTPHTNDIPRHHGRSFEIAQPRAETLGILLIRAAEVTRGEPPGHWNAFFLNNVALLDTPAYLDALQAATNQGAFIVWNHPGWKQPNQKSVWYPQQEEVFFRGMLHGIEIVNGSDYDPIAHQWCLTKQLTMLGNSDTHVPTSMEYGPGQGLHRPLTLVFVRERSLAGVREALMARRTAVYANQSLIGEEPYLRPLFERALTFHNAAPVVNSKGRAFIQIFNASPVPFKLRLAKKVAGLSVPQYLILAPQKTVGFEIRVTSRKTGQVPVWELPYTAENLLIAPGKGMPVTLKFTPVFEAEK